MISSSPILSCPDIQQAVLYRSCVVGKKVRSKEAIQIVANVGCSVSEETKDTSSISEVDSISISRSTVDTIILGSAGYWYVPAGILNSRRAGPSTSRSRSSSAMSQPASPPQCSHSDALAKQSKLILSRGSKSPDSFNLKDNTWASQRRQGSQC